MGASIILLKSRDVSCHKVPAVTRKFSVFYNEVCNWVAITVEVLFLIYLFIYAFTDNRITQFAQP